jgi:hypothetical protein
MAIRFDDTQYTFSHGARPRGRGSWGFGLGEKSPLNGPTLVFSPPDLTFAEARRWARKTAQERGFTGTIFVQP